MYNVDLKDQISNGAKGVILVDTSWIIHKNYNAINVSIVKNGEMHKTGHIYGTVRLAQSLISLYKDYIVIFCADSHDKDKKDLLPSYKEGRVRSFDLSYISKEVFKIVGFIDNVYVATAKGVEADEVMHSVAASIPLSLDCVLLVGDNDLLQTMAKFSHVRIARKITKSKQEFIDQSYVDSKFGVALDRILFYRVLIGDPSDNIEGVVSKAKAKVIVNSFTSIQDFLKEVPEVADKVNLNLQLMELKEKDFKLWKSTKEESISTAVDWCLTSFLSSIADSVGRV